MKITISPSALHTLVHLINNSNTEVGWRAISPPDRPFHISSVWVPLQKATGSSYETLEGEGDIDWHINDFVTRGIDLARVTWLDGHSHPGSSTTPSSTDLTHWRGLFDGSSGPSPSHKIVVILPREITLTGPLSDLRLANTYVSALFKAPIPCVSWQAIPSLAAISDLSITLDTSDQTPFLTSDQLATLLARINPPSSQTTSGPLIWDRPSNGWPHDSYNWEHGGSWRTGTKTPKLTRKQRKAQKATNLLLPPSVTPAPTLDVPAIQAAFGEYNQQVRLHRKLWPFDMIEGICHAYLTNREFHVSNITSNTATAIGEKIARGHRDALVCLRYIAYKDGKAALEEYLRIGQPDNDALGAMLDLLDELEVSEDIIRTIL